MNNKLQESNVKNTTSNHFAVELLFAISKQYSVSVNAVIMAFDNIKYWGIINDDDVCCILAHDGIKSTIHDLEDRLNVVLSRHTI